MNSNLSILFNDENTNSSKQTTDYQKPLTNLKDNPYQQHVNNEYNKDIKSSEQLCKFYLNNCCTKGISCPFSHNLKKFPCKFFHGLGYCDKGLSCPFSHLRLMTETQVFRFINDNIEFLNELMRKIGKTNMDEFYMSYNKSHNLMNNEITTIPKLVDNTDKIYPQKESSIYNPVYPYYSQATNNISTTTKNQIDANYSHDNVIHNSNINQNYLVPNIVDPFKLTGLFNNK